MATILLLDANEVAGRAMPGILARGRHKGLITTTIADAWKALHEQVRVDLVFLELELKGEKGIDFLQRLRADSFLKNIPVVIYTAVNEQAVVRRVLGLKVQNYLIKPYNDEYIFREIAKAATNPWRNLQFEEEKSFCAQMSYKPEDLRAMRAELRESLDKSRPFFEDCVTSRKPEQVHARIDALAERAELCGVWGVVEYLADLKTRAGTGDWSSFKKCDEDLTYAGELIHCHLEPGYVPHTAQTAEEKEAQLESQARAVWMNTDVDKRGPMLSAEEVLLQVAALPACPVMDPVVAAFQMSADKSTSSNLNPINDLVARDPGLLTQVLIAANHLDHDEMTTIDDPRTAVSLLGNQSLAAMAKTLPTIPERHMNIFPITWSNFWMFQVGVASVAQYTAKYLEFEQVAHRAYTAGLLHDIGRLILVKLFPFGAPAMVAYAKEHHLPLHEAEKKYLGCTSREMGERFVRQQGLPGPYCNVIRFAESPEQAAEDIELVGVVALARGLCLHNHVGFCGDTPKDASPSLDQTLAWQVLQPKVFPSFNLQKFEVQVHAFCLELKQNLAGRQASA